MRDRTTKRPNASASLAEGHPATAASRPTPAFRPAAAVATRSHMANRAVVILVAPWGWRAQPKFLSDEQLTWLKVSSVKMVPVTTRSIAQGSPGTLGGGVAPSSPEATSVQLHTPGKEPFDRAECSVSTDPRPISTSFKISAVRSARSFYTEDQPSNLSRLGQRPNFTSMCL